MQCSDTRSAHSWRCSTPLTSRGRPVASVISSGLPSAAFLDGVQRNLESFESILSDQLPFHFRDPLDPRIDAMRAELSEVVHAPDVLRAAAASDYGAIDVQGRLPSVTHPTLVLAGCHDRTCSLVGAEAIAEGIPDAELVVFEDSGT